MTVDDFLSKRANPGDFHHSEWIEFMRELEQGRNDARKEAETIRDISLIWPDQRDTKFPWENAGK